MRTYGNYLYVNNSAVTSFTHQKTYYGIFLSLTHRATLKNKRRKKAIFDSKVLGYFSSVHQPPNKFDLESGSLITIIINSRPRCPRIFRVTVTHRIACKKCNPLRSCTILLCAQFCFSIGKTLFSNLFRNHMDRYASLNLCWTGSALT